MDYFQLFYSGIISLILFFLVISLVRKRILRVSYSILWLIASLTLLVAVLRYNWVVRLSFILNLLEPKNLFFFITIFFLLALCIQFSIIISGLVLKVKNLAQKIVLLEHQLVSEQHPDLSE